MESIYAEIITIGDEILYGQITDTNSQWISAELAKIGVKTIRKTSIGDDKNEIIQALNEAKKRASIILLTGGLGPTKDDITKRTLAEFFNTSLILHEEALAHITELFHRRGKQLSETNKSQAYLPATCTYLKNSLGTAPGMWFEQNNKIFISMAGVPYEMKDILSKEGIPKIKAYFKTPTIIHKYIQTIGIGESNLSEIIEPWENKLPPHIKLAYLPSIGMVKLRLTGTGNNQKFLSDEMAQLINQVEPIIQEYIFNYTEDTLEKTISNLLLEKKLTIATAESCTGGYVSHLLTSLPGSSAYFKGGIIAYSNEIKTTFTDLTLESIDQHGGAVSEFTVLAMAKGIRTKMKTAIGIAASGIAGPDGGTPDKPVGTIWIAYSDAQKSMAKKLVLTTDRMLNIRLTANYLLDMVRKAI